LFLLARNNLAFWRFYACYADQPASLQSSRDDFSACGASLGRMREMTKGKMGYLTAAAIAAPLLCTSAAHATVIQMFANTTGILPTPLQTEVLNNTLVGSGANIFSVTVNAQGQPLPGGGILDSTAIQVSSSGGTGQLFIWVTETGITAPIGTLNFISGFENNAQSTNAITGTTSLDTANIAYVSGTVLSSELITPGEDNLLSHIAATGAGPYSVTEEFVVTNLPGGINNTNTIQLTAAAPEPASLALLGVGLLGLGFVTSRKRRV
jgi:hypothetical protein